MKLALIFRVGVAVDCYDADRRAGGVRDDDGLRQSGHEAGRRHSVGAGHRRRGGHTPKRKHWKQKLSSFVLKPTKHQMRFLSKH